MNVINNEALGTLAKQIYYTSDALGRRLQKKVVDKVDSTKSFTRKYIYNGSEILAELDGGNKALATYTHSLMRSDRFPVAAQISSDGVSAGLAPANGAYYFLKDRVGIDNRPSPTVLET